MPFPIGRPITIQNPNPKPPQNQTLPSPIENLIKLFDPSGTTNPPGVIKA